MSGVGEEEKGRVLLSSEEMELKQLEKSEYPKTELKTGILWHFCHEFIGVGFVGFILFLFYLLGVFNAKKKCVGFLNQKFLEFSQSFLFSLKGISFPLSFLPRAESFWITLQARKSRLG